MVQAVPEGFNTVSAHLICSDPDAAIAFYQQAFGAEVGCRMCAPDGSVMHAELRIGSSTVMLAGENPEYHMKSPTTLGARPSQSWCRLWFRFSIQCR